MRALAIVIPPLLLLAACAADPVGERNDDPLPDDTGWRTDFEACATERVEASLVTTSLFLAVDKSSSMNEPLEDGDTDATAVTKWDAATSAFTAFFRDPASARMSLALRLWPTVEDGCENETCDAAACSVATVDLGLVGDASHQQALIDAFGVVPDEGGTPMYAALDGATRWGVARHAAAPDESVAIIFVTDGEPNGCDEDIAHIAALATASAAGGVPVYAVGIEGSNADQINQIAAAGGTTAGYFVGDANAEADLIAALRDIQSQQVSCEFVFPESTGEPLSPDLIRVEYDEGGGPVLVQRVADAASCADGGWYLDAPTDPPTITLCPSTCATMQGIAEVAIEVDVGCECATDDDCPGDDRCSPDGCIPPCAGDDCIEFWRPKGEVAVQGGALNCSTAPGIAGVLVSFAAMGLLRRRERR